MTVDKPCIDDFAASMATLTWHRSGAGGGAVETAVAVHGGARWVLLRLNQDPDRRVLVYSEHEWACFLDGAKRGEFDDVMPRDGKDPHSVASR